MRIATMLVMLAAVPVCAQVATTTNPPAVAGYQFPSAPEGARTLTLPLATVDAVGRNQPGYIEQRSSTQLKPLDVLPEGLAELNAGKESFAYEIATLADGTRYLAVLNVADVKILNRNTSELWYARFAKVAPGEKSKAEVVREGYLTSGGDATIPVQLTFPPLGTDQLTTRFGEVGFSWNGTSNREPMIYTSRGSALRVSGSQLFNEGKLTATVTVPEDYKVSASTAVSLKFEPLTPGLPERTASGELKDLMTLGTARFVVTGLAPDFSSINLAIVASSLEETLKQQIQLGQQMPAFAQVDLLTRTTLTKESLLGQAAGGPGIVMVFGNLPVPGTPNFGNIPMQRTLLPVPPAEVASLLGADMPTKPVVVVVTREVSIEMLYSTLRNTTPPYTLLTDFVDPLRTTFRQPQNMGGYYGGGWSSASPDATLRQLLNLPADTTSVAAFDPTGKVVYVRADASEGFLTALAEAREALKAAK